MSTWPVNRVAMFLRRKKQTLLLAAPGVVHFTEDSTFKTLRVWWVVANNCFAEAVHLLKQKWSEAVLSGFTICG